MSNLRPIRPMLMPADVPRAGSFGKRPELRWTAPSSLLVDGTYQRDLSRQSVRLIRGLVEKFAWNRMKPPIVVETSEGLHVVDGQHTAIAAATLGIKEIPVFIVEATTLDERARAFVGHNTDRITLTPIGIFKGLVAAGDPDALDVANVCKRAGVRVRLLNQSIVPAEGDTMAIGTLRKLIGRRGVINSRRVLEVLVKARRAPISAEEIRAADYLLCEGGADQQQLTRAVRIEGDKGLGFARAKATTDRQPIWRMLADRWAKHLERSAA